MVDRCSTDLASLGLTQLIERDPVIYVRYEGIRGKTQGEMNDSNPAEKATTRETLWVTPNILSPLVEGEWTS